MRLSDCSAKLRPLQVLNFADCDIEDVTNDSRAVRSGSLFCAIRGAKADGRRFVPAAEAAGAAAIISDDPELKTSLPHLVCADAYRAWGLLCELAAGNPAQAMTLHAVTGTNGKTTIAFLLRNLLQNAGHFRTGLISTIEYDCGNGTASTESARTTPDAASFQRILTQMHNAGCQHVVLEASSHGLHQHRMGSARFATAIFTNLTGDHLDYHKTMEAYFQAKKLLFTESLAENGNAVINIDDPWGARLASELKRPVLSLSMTHPDATVRIEPLEESAAGTVFRLHSPGHDLTIHSPLIGTHNIYNLASAVTAALALGIPETAILKALETPVQVPGRLERIELPDGAAAFVDYAHTDDALERVLTALRPLCKGRLIALFGCGGDRDRSKRPRMAEVCGRLADLTILTSDNPRTEPPEAIIAEAETGFPRGAKYETVVDRPAAIRRAVELARPDDILLVAGKGHENYQEINGVKHHMDDRELIREAIR